MEQKKIEEIFILMSIPKMTLTEINTLTNNEKHYHLSKWFLEQNENQEKTMKNYGK